MARTSPKNRLLLEEHPQKHRSDKSGSAFTKQCRVLFSEKSRPTLARLSLFWHATLQHFIVCVVLALELSWLALIQPATPPFWYAWRMERVTVRTFLQAHSRPAKFGSVAIVADGFLVR